jgi:hypothetical protein
MTMEAKVGDEIIVDAPRTGGEPRKGEVLEVLETGGVRHYRVRWDDGHEALFYPGSDAHAVRLAKH